MRLFACLETACYKETLRLKKSSGFWGPQGIGVQNNWSEWSGGFDTLLRVPSC